MIRGLAHKLRQHSRTLQVEMAHSAVDIDRVVESEAVRDGGESGVECTLPTAEAVHEHSGRGLMEEWHESEWGPSSAPLGGAELVADPRVRNDCRCHHRSLQISVSMK